MKQGPLIYSNKVDVFALGITIFQLFNLFHPFEDEDEPALTVSRIKGDAEPN